MKVNLSLQLGQEVSFAESSILPDILFYFKKTSMKALSHKNKTKTISIMLVNIRYDCILILNFDNFHSSPS